MNTPATPEAISSIASCTRHYRRLPDTEEHTVLRLRSEGKRLRQISRETGHAVSTIVRILQDHDMPTVISHAGNCKQCGKPFVSKSKHPQIFCSVACSRKRAPAAPRVHVTGKGSCLMASAPKIATAIGVSRQRVYQLIELYQLRPAQSGHPDLYYIKDFPQYNRIRTALEEN